MKLVKFALFAACATLVAGCGSSSSDEAASSKPAPEAASVNPAAPEAAPVKKTAEPQDVAIDFMEAVAKLDFKTAGKMASPETKALLDMFASMGEEDGMEAHPNATFKVVSTSVDGDTAKVKIRMTDDGESEENDIDLKKIDGEWKVVVNKDE